MGKRHAEHQIVVARSPQECFDALVDFEAYPHWQSAVRACEVQSLDRDGRPRRVSFEVDANPSSMTYTLDYAYESPHLVSWAFVEGAADGEFVLEDLGDGTTLATYSLQINSATEMPARMTPVLDDQAMQRSVEDLKARVESGA